MEYELYHHGVKGQKWGVRRYQNKDGSLTPAGKKRVSNKQLREERSELRKKYYDMEDHSKIAKLENEIIELTSKYDFDLDDGGGGTTIASRKAGRHYMELNDKLMDLYNDMDDRVHKKVTNELINKYGKQRIDRFNTQENVAVGMKVAGVLFGIPVGLGVLIGLTSSR